MIATCHKLIGQRPDLAFTNLTPNNFSHRLFPIETLSKLHNKRSLGSEPPGSVSEPVSFSFVEKFSHLFSRSLSLSERATISLRLQTLTKRVDSQRASRISFFLQWSLFIVTGYFNNFQVLIEAARSCVLGHLPST